MNKSELTAAQKKAIAAILATRSYAEAAEAAGVARQSIYTWLKQSEFKKELDGQLNEITREATGRLRKASGLAVDKLVALLGSQNESIRLKSAHTIIEYAIKVQEMSELSARIDEIEKRLKE